MRSFFCHARSSDLTGGKNDHAENHQARSDDILQHPTLAQKQNRQDGGKNRRSIDDRRRARDADPFHADITEGLADSRGEYAAGDEIADVRIEQGGKRDEDDEEEPKDDGAGTERNQRSGKRIGMHQAAPDEYMGDRKQQCGLKREVFGHARRCNKKGRFVAAPSGEIAPQSQNSATARWSGNLSPLEESKAESD